MEKKPAADDVREMKISAAIKRNTDFMYEYFFLY